MILTIYVNAKLRKVLYSPTHLYVIQLKMGDVVDVTALPASQPTGTLEERFETLEIEVPETRYYKFGLTKEGKLIAGLT